MAHRKTPRTPDLTRELTTAEKAKIARRQATRKGHEGRHGTQFPDSPNQVELTETPAHFVHPSKRR